MRFLKCFCVAIVAVIIGTDVAFARGRRPQQMQYQQPVYQQSTSQIVPVSYQVGQVGGAQAKAEAMARSNSMQHLPGGFGGGSFEGVGFGSTREQAITVSCFWGQRTPIEIGAAQGSNGWYACVFYR